MPLISTALKKLNFSVNAYQIGNPENENVFMNLFNVIRMLYCFYECEKVIAVVPHLHEYNSIEYKYQLIVLVGTIFIKVLLI